MHELVLHVPASAVDAISEALSDELDALSVSIADADAGTAAERPVFDEPGIDADTWRRAVVTALFAHEAQAVAAASVLLAASATGGETATTVHSIAAVDDRDWVRLTQAQFAPAEIAPGFWVVPTWADVPAGAQTVLRLDPGMAFGTGTHPTTRICLQWLAAHSASSSMRPRRVLDYGCGSGILAIAAALFGSADVDAVDIDEEAVLAAQANAAANGAAVHVGGAQIVAGLYDIVFANILATPLKVLAPLLSSYLGAGGTLVLSGILVRQADELRAAYAPWLPLDVAATDDGWILMTGRLAGAKPVA